VKPVHESIDEIKLDAEDSVGDDDEKDKSGEDNEEEEPIDDEADKDIKK